MTIYKVSDNFIVERQVDHTLCWAATVRAVAGHMNVNMPDQNGLQTEYAGKTDGNDVKKVLKARGIENTVLFDWSKDGDDMSEAEKLADLAANLQHHLTNPLLCGLMPANFSRTDNKSYRHATLIYQYDDSKGGTVGIADPARDVNAKFTVTLKELVNGFHYMNKADLGPRSAAMIKSDDQVLLTKIYSLTEFRR